MAAAAKLGYRPGRNLNVGAFTTLMCKMRNPWVSGSVPSLTLGYNLRCGLKAMEHGAGTRLSCAPDSIPRTCMAPAGSY
jgi:hypothetical protein